MVPVVDRGASDRTPRLCHDHRFDIAVHGHGRVELLGQLCRSIVDQPASVQQCLRNLDLDVVVDAGTGKADLEIDWIAGDRRGARDGLVVSRFHTFGTHDIVDQLGVSRQNRCRQVIDHLLWIDDAVSTRADHQDRWEGQDNEPVASHATNPI